MDAMVRELSGAVEAVPARWRTRRDVARALRDDAGSWIYRWVWRPMLALQVLSYLRVVFRFVRHPVYPVVGGAADPLLRENHIGNLVVLKSQPNLPLLSVHLAMALFWMIGVLVQKQMVAQMAAAATAARAATYARYRRVHAVVGWSLLLLGTVGILIGPIITIAHHGNEPMKMFLVGQPLFFLPLFAMTLISARTRRWSIRTHRFWAEAAFLGPGLASLWAEAMIYVFGHYTPLGPRVGEVTASAVAAVLGVLLVVLPSFIARGRGLRADAAARA